MSLPFDARKLVTAFAADNRDVTQLKFINDDPDGVKIETLTGGVVNYCFRISSDAEKSSVVLKHSENVAKDFEWDNLSCKRQRVEYDCLTLLHSLIPGNVPEPYILDTRHNIIAMQDLSDWELLGNHLENNGPDLNVASELGRVLAKMHQDTSKMNVTPEYWEELSRFRQADPQAIAYSYMCEKYYVNPDELTHLPPLVKDAYQKYYKSFDITDMQATLGKLIYEERCLVQLDSHWKSVFVKDGHIAMFDFEFVFLGHPGVSLGYYISSFLVCFLAYMEKHKTATGNVLPTEERMDVQRKFHSAVVRLLTNYMEGVRDISDENKGAFISEVTLFCGAELCLMSLFENITLIDDAVTPEVRVGMLHAGFRLMKSYGSILTSEQLADVIFNE